MSSSIPGMLDNSTHIDYGDYSYRKTILMTFDIGLVSLASMVVLLRFYTRIYISKYFGQDDWWMLASWILSLTNLSIWVKYLELGSWKHQSDIPFEDLETMFMILWLMQWILSFVHGTMNISVLTFYLRVFQDQSLRFRRLIYAFIFFTASASTAVVLTIIFQCSPADSYWRSDTLFSNRNCVDSEKLLYTQSGLILFCDIALFVMPMKYLWELNIPKWQRIQVMFLVGLGVLTCVASIFRVVALHKLTITSDRTYDGFGYSLWTSTELFVALITTCLPPCRPLLLRVCCNGRRRSWSYTWTRTTSTHNTENPSTHSGTYLSKDDDRNPTPSSSRRRLSSREGRGSAGGGEEMGPMDLGATVRIGPMGRVERVYSYESSTRRYSGHEEEAGGPLGGGPMGAMGSG